MSSTAHLLSLIDKCYVVSSGKYLFISPEQEAHPLPSHLYPPHHGKVQQAYPPFQRSFLIHVHCLPAQVPVSLAVNILDVCCTPSRGWEAFFFSEPGPLSTATDRPKACGSRSSCFCPFYQLKCPPITSNCRHLTEARFRT